MKFAVNYINDEVLEQSIEKDTYIKYPGGKWDLETLSNLTNKDFKVVLHGIIPSSGSILDPKLCDKFDEFAKYIKLTNQFHLSFHFDYKDKYNEPDYIKTLEKNLKIIRSYFPDIEILIENLPPVDNIKSWCAEPKIFNNVLEKYNLKMLLDIPHAEISAEYFGISYEDYINQFPLDKVKEIHFSGLGYTLDNKLYDGHIEANERDFALFESTIKKCKNLSIISLEFAPTRDYDGQTVAKDYISKRTNKNLFEEQQRQLKRMKDIVNKIY